MLTVKNISKAFNGQKVLANVSFDFPKGEVTAIAGPSGTGKTTLLNIIMGLLPSDTGTVSIPEGNKLSAVFQENRLIEHFTAEQNIRLLPEAKAYSTEEIEAAFHAVGLEIYANKPVANFSGGMKRRVAIVRAALSKPDILILDEPFKGVDSANRKKSVAFLKEACPDATVLLVTHDPEERKLMGTANELVLMPADPLAKTAPEHEWPWE